MNDPRSAIDRSLVSKKLWRRVADLEKENADLRHDIARHVEIAAIEVTRAETARREALEEAARVCFDMNSGWASDDHLQCAFAIRNLMERGE